MLTREKVVTKFGEELILEAEAVFETDFNKTFWGPQLSDIERIDYIFQAHMWNGLTWETRWFKELLQ